MATKVRIGHASTSKASTAAAEVLIGTYSASLKPTVLLRPATPELAEKSALACEAGCNNDHIEYSQNLRSTLYNKAKQASINYDLSKINETCYADCSSFMTVCALAGGADLTFSSLPTCGNMRKVFTAGGYYIAYTADKYLTSSDYLQRGDILVREDYSVNNSRHTVMILDNGSMIPANSVVSTKPLDLNIVKISTDIMSISTDNAIIKAKLATVKNGIESSLANVDSYKWSYNLTTIDNMKLGSITKSFKADNNNTKLAITGLSPDTSYCLILTATSGDASFSSPRILFTTAANKAAEKATKEASGTKQLTLRKINRIYVKINDIFKQATLYNPNK